MADYAIRNDYDKSQALKRLESMPLPFTQSLTKGAKRSIEQNRLQRMLLLQIAEQGDQTAEEYRGFCKLHIGVAIAKENLQWAEKYDKYIRPMDYESKLDMMMVPMDFPVTRIMDTRQKTRYIDGIYTHFTGLGFVLTMPES